MNKRLDIANFKPPEDYFDKKVFRGAVLVLFITAFYGLFQNDFDLQAKKYYYCPINTFGNMPCKIEFGCEDTDSPFCIPESIITLQPGDSYGEKPPFIVQNFGIFSLIVLMVALIINHFFYLKRKKGGLI